MKKLFAFLSLFGLANAYALPLDVNSPKTIKTQKVEYDVKSGTVRTKGKTEITNAAGQRMTLQDSYISQRGEQLSGDDIKIWLGQHVYIESDNITRNGDDTIARKAMFTACYDCDKFGNAWEINATKITHDMSDRMLSFRNMVFHIYDIPVLYLPYYTMPDPGVKHKSGFLVPNMESTNKMGLQFNIPVYLYLSNTHDATFTLSYLTKENPLLQAEHRLNLAHSEFRTRGSFTHNREGENRWHIFNNDVIELGEYARASIFIARASDKTYLQKYGFYEDQPYLDSGARVELFGRSSYAVADAHVFQELRSNIRHNTAVPSGNILPNIRGVYQSDPLFAETYFTLSGDVLGIVEDGTSSQRMIGEARVTSPWTLWGGNRVTASIATRYDVYNFHNVDMVDGDKFSGLKNRFLPSGYVEWGLPFVKSGASWSQTIEPRARLTIVRRTDQDEFAQNNDSAGAFLSDTVLFSDNRFAGYDLWENGTFADYGVRWAAFNNDGRTVEVFLGQSYDLTDRAATDINSGFHNGASDYVGRIGFNNSDWLDVSSRFRFDRDSFNLRHAETSAVIGRENYITIGHIWARQFIDAQTLAPDINEAMVGLGFRITDRWSLQFNAIYNWTEDTFLRHTGTLFYNHPCYYLSFGYRRDNAVREDYQGNTTIQFRFGMMIEGQKY